MPNKRNIVIGIGGSSGSIYARLLLNELEKYKDQIDNLGIVISSNGLANWELENPEYNFKGYPFDYYTNKDFSAPFASGSAQYDTMIICPCSMGLLGRIAHGISNDLLTRAADVILKERRKLIVVPREAPMSTLHLENMLKLSQHGAIVCPAIPSFYSKPKTFEETALTVVHRVLDLARLDIDTYRWGQ